MTLQQAAVVYGVSEILGLVSELDTSPLILKALLQSKPTPKLGGFPYLSRIFPNQSLQM